MYLSLEQDAASRSFIHSLMKPKEYRIVLLEERGAGGPSMIAQFVYQSMDPSEHYICHVFQGDYDLPEPHRKEVTVDGEVCVLVIELISYQSQVTSSQLRRGDGFLVIYSIDSHYSFEEAVSRWISILFGCKDYDRVPLVIVGNKCDLGEEHRQVLPQEGEEAAKSLRIPRYFFETSAKLPFNLEEAFFELVREIRRHLPILQEMRLRERQRNRQRRMEELRSCDLS